MHPRTQLRLRPSNALPRPFSRSVNASSYAARSFSNTSRSSDSKIAKPHNPPARQPSAASRERWLSETKTRIGRCLSFGTTPAQTRLLGGVLRTLGESWRELVAGREGFLTDRKRAGLLRQRVVWGEMDSMAHVNNVTYTRYAESARLNWLNNYAIHVDPGRRREWSELWTPRGEGLILKSIKTDYKFPMTWPDHISVFHKFHSIPSPDSHSFTLDVMILSELHQRPAARCVEDTVVYDYRKGKKIAIRPFMLDAFVEVWKEQEETKKRNIERIEELERVVRQLEKETWDREDAVEDFGGQK